MIAAQRHRFLNNETNVGVTDFMSQVTSDLMSIGTVIDETVVRSLSELAVAARAATVGQIEAAAKLVDNKLYTTTNGINAAVTRSDVNNGVLGAFPGQPGLQTAVSRMPLGVGAAVLSGNPAKDVISIVNGTVTTVTTAVQSEINTLVDGINTMTNGAFAPGISSHESATRLLTAVAKQAMLYGLPPVFQQLIPVFKEVAVVVMAAKQIYQLAVGLGDALQATDILRSSVGPTVLLNNPLAMRDYVKLMTTPGNNRNPDYYQRYLEMETTLAGLDPKYWASVVNFNNVVHTNVSSNVYATAGTDAPPMLTTVVCKDTLATYNTDVTITPPPVTIRETHLASIGKRTDVLKELNGLLPGVLIIRAI